MKKTHCRLPVSTPDIDCVGKKLAKETYQETKIFDDNYKTVYTQEFNSMKKKQYSKGPENNLKNFTTKKLNNFLDDKALSTKKHIRPNDHDIFQQKIKVNRANKKESNNVNNKYENYINNTTASSYNNKEKENKEKRSSSCFAQDKKIKDVFQNNPLSRVDSSLKIQGKKVLNLNKSDNAFGKMIADQRMINKSNSINNTNKSLNTSSKKLNVSSSLALNNTLKRKNDDFDIKITNKTMPNSPKVEKKNIIDNNKQIDTKDFNKQINSAKISPRSFRKEFKNFSTASLGIKELLKNTNPSNTKAEKIKNVLSVKNNNLNVKSNIIRKVK